jgi:uncharacterized protein YndB with AHSA1/START domain
MKWIAGILAGLAAIGAAMTLWGLALPRTHRVTSRLVLRQPPDTVWAALRDIGGTKAWWKDLTGVERVPDTSGRERWRETMGNGFGMVVVVSDETPGRRFVTDIETTAESAFGGQWTYEVAPAPGGTEVRITEEGWVSNPIFRVVSRISGYHHTLDGYLAALAARFGEPARPEHLP